MERGESSRTYSNPLAQARTVGFLQSIQEDESLRGESEQQKRTERERKSKSMPEAHTEKAERADPFHQRVDSTRKVDKFLNRTLSMPHYQQALSVSVEGGAGADDPQQHKSRTFSSYLRRMNALKRVPTRRGIPSTITEEAESSSSARKHRRLKTIEGCIGFTNKILQFVLMVMAILLIVASFAVLSNVAGPAKTVLVRVGNMLGERSIELNNVTISTARMGSVGLGKLQVPPVQNLISQLFDTNIGKDGVVDPDPLGLGALVAGQEGEERVNAMSLSEMEAAETAFANGIEMKDAQNEADDKFMAWCEAAPCTEGFRATCPAVGRGLDKGQRNGVPVIPFPREFCASVRQLNQAGCLCDENIMDVPQAERLSQSASLVATMCGFRNELEECG